MVNGDDVDNDILVSPVELVNVNVLIKEIMNGRLFATKSSIIHVIY